MMAARIDGKEFAARVREEVAQGVKDLQASHGVTPGLAVVSVGEDPASQVYVRNKLKYTKACGMNSFHRALDADTSRRSLLLLIELRFLGSIPNNVLRGHPLDSPFL